jgi:hypothetical protein
MVVSVDELRAASRLLGAHMPPFLAEGDPDDTRVDLAALRGLAARGLVVGLEVGGPEPVGDLADALAALDDMVALAEVVRDLGAEGGGAAERSAVARGRTATVVLHHRAGGLVDVTMDVADPGSVIVERCALGDLGAQRTVTPEPWSVDSDALERAEDLIMDGEGGSAATVLVSAGAPAESAGHWVRAVEQRRGGASVTVARLLGDPDDAVEVRDVRWLVDGDGLGWRVDGGDSETTVVRTTTADELRQELTEMARCVS